jgi:glutathione S-transferase
MAMKGKLNGNKLHIFGDYFDADTRALVAICRHAGVEYEFNQVNVLERENEREPYILANQTGSVPMLLLDDFKVIS